jgi:hypothetical protein
VLPPDRNGNFVIALEPCKAKSCSAGSQRRCFFYILHVLCEQQATGKEKLVVLAFMNDIDHEQVHGSATYIDVQHSFPIELDFLHIFFQSVGLGWFSQQSAAEDMLSKLLNAPNDRKEVHSLQGDLEESFYAIYGLDTRHIPVRLGGLWKLGDFHTWQKERVETERIRNPNPAWIVTPNVTNTPYQDNTKLLYSPERNPTPVDTILDHYLTPLVEKPFQNSPVVLYDPQRAYADTCETKDFEYALTLLENSGHNIVENDIDCQILDNCSIQGLDDNLDCFSVTSQLFDEIVVEEWYD